MDNELKFEQKGSQSIYISIARNLRFHELRPKSKPMKDEIFKSKKILLKQRNMMNLYIIILQKKKTIYVDYIVRTLIKLKSWSLNTVSNHG